MVVRQQAFHVNARELALVQIHLHVLEFGLVEQLGANMVPLADHVLI